MTARWRQRLSAWRNRKHELPYTPAELLEMRRRAWRLVHRSQQAKAADS